MLLSLRGKLAVCVTIAPHVPSMFNTKARARRVLIVPLLMICLANCSRQTTDGPTPVLSQPPSTTFPMPPVSSNGSLGELGWTLGDGSRANFAGQRGKVLVLDFYATWCAPCRESIPHLIALRQRYEEKGLMLIGLNVGGPDDRVKVPDFAAEFGITYPLGFPDKPLTDFLLADDPSIPQTFVFNREGQLIKRYIGYDQSMPANLEDVIATELTSSK